MADVHRLDAFRPQITFEPDEGIVLSTRIVSTLPAIMAISDAEAIPKGGDWTRIITYRLDGELVDLSTYTASYVIKDSPEATTALVTLTEVAGITLGSYSQNIRLAMTAAETAALDFVRAWAALEVTSGAGVVTRLLIWPAVDLVR